MDSQVITFTLQAPHDNGTVASSRNDTSSTMDFEPTGLRPNYHAIRRHPPPLKESKKEERILHMAYQERGKRKVLDRPPHHRPATPTGSFANAHAGHGAIPSPNQILDLQYDAHVHQAGRRYAPRLGPVPAVERQGAVQVAVPGVVQRLQRAVVPSYRRGENKGCQTHAGQDKGAAQAVGHSGGVQVSITGIMQHLLRRHREEQGRHKVWHRTRHNPWDTPLPQVWLTAAYSTCHTWHILGARAYNTPWIIYSVISLFLFSLPFFTFGKHTHSSLITSLVRPR